MKPDLILHPGFPKCATTSLQQLFIMEGHALGKSMGVGFIGADFRPDNGYPPVSKLMYRHDEAVADVLGNDYPPGRYFLSNEALSGKPAFLEVLASRFRLDRAVFTLRFPVLQALSGFRYSGWLEEDFAGFLAKQGGRLFEVEGKYAQPVKRYDDARVPVRLVPIEGTALEARFFRAAFDAVPALLAKPPFDAPPRSNESVPFAFADALARGLAAGVVSRPQGPQRHAMVIAAQNHVLPEELAQLAPPQMAAIDRDAVMRSLAAYRAFLAARDTPDLDAICAAAEAGFDKLARLPAPTPAQAAELDARARRLLEANAPAAPAPAPAAPAPNPATAAPKPAPKPVARPEAAAPELPAETDGTVTTVPLRVRQVFVSNAPRPRHDNAVRVGILPGKPPICRVRLEGTFDELDHDSTLVFDFHAIGRPLAPDIITGDAGFPNVVLRNTRGVHVRFARGNLKDFFDIQRSTERQTVALPLGAFVFDRDMTNNPPLAPGESFFDHPVDRIFFDVLRHRTEELELLFGDFRLQQGRPEPHPPVQDLVVFDRSDQARGLPKFAVERPQMGFRVALNMVALSLGYAGASLRAVLEKNGTERARHEVTLGPEARELKLELRERGAYSLRLALELGDRRIAEEEIPLCHVVPRDGTRPAAGLGISDGTDYDRIALAGGTWDRLPVTLGMIYRDPANGDFRFQKSLDFLPRTRRAPGENRILSVFEMPKWLSRFPERGDFARFGPGDWDEYARLVRWLAKTAQDKGFTHYEVWNEASAYGHWADDMETLIRLHQVTREAVHAAAPGMVVLGGCTHSWDMDFLGRFFEAGGGDHCDGLTIHGYTYQPDRLPAQFDALEALIDAHVAPERDFGLHVTEIGFRMPAFPAMDQADLLTLFTLEALSRTRTRGVLWFRYANPRPELGSGYRQNSSTGYAMIGYGDRYCRPAYAAYRFTDLLLGESERVEASGSGDDRLYRIIGAPGTVALAARSRAALEKAAPPPWRRMDSCGGPLGDRESGTLFLALRPGFFV